MTPPQVWGRDNVLIPLEQWEHVSTDEVGIAVFRYTGRTAVFPVRIVAPSGDEMPVLAGCSFAPGMTLGLPTIPRPAGAKSGPMKIRAMGNVIRNGMVVRD